MVIGEWRGQGHMDLARAARARFTAYPLDHVERRQEDALLPQHVYQCCGEYNPSVGLLR